MTTEPATREELTHIAKELEGYAKRINPYDPPPMFTAATNRDLPCVDAERSNIAQQLKDIAKQIRRYLYEHP